MTICAAAALAWAAAPTSASAFKLVKTEGLAAINKHTEIHTVSHVEFDTLGSGFKCEMNATWTTEDGTEATTHLADVTLITNTCVGSGFFEGCTIKEDSAGASENTVIDSNTLTTDLAVIAATGSAPGKECPFTFVNVFIEPVSVIVGTGPVTVGVLEGEGLLEDDFGLLPVAINGEMTIGQYTEEGANKGSAKGVFRITE